MPRLYENLQSFERTIRRQEWNEIWRWMRVTKKELAEQEVRRVELLRQDIPRHLKDDILYDLIYPALVVHEKQRL